MFSSIIMILVLGLANMITGVPTGSGSNDISIDVIIPREYTPEEYKKSVFDYWTPERMASAVPLHPVISVQHITSSMNNYEDDGIEQILTPSTLLPGIRASTPIAAGRIFFNYGQWRYSCSGSVLTAQNKDTVCSAAHCVFNTTTKEFATNWIFIPAYNYDARPYGTFTARRFAVKQEWQNNINYAYDTAIVLVGTNENNEHVQDRTGGFGITLSAPQAAMTNLFGYPGNMNNAQTMSTCAAKSSNSFYGLLFGYDLLQVSCTMGPGSSGGPWLRNYNTGTLSGQQVSVTSFSFNLQPNVLHGPRFVQNNIGSLFQDNQNL